MQDECHCAHIPCTAYPNGLLTATMYSAHSNADVVWTRGVSMALLHTCRRYSSATWHCMNTQQIRLTILVQDHGVCLMLAKTRDRTEAWKLFTYILFLVQLYRGYTTRRGYFGCTTLGSTYVRSSLPGRACIRADKHNTTRTAAHRPEHAAGEIPANCIHRIRPAPHPFRDAEDDQRKASEQTHANEA